MDLQYLWLFCLLVVLGSFTQGFTGIGFGIIILAGIAFIPWDFERSTVVVSLLILVLHSSVIFFSVKESKIQWKLIGYVLAGLAFGVPLGYLFIVSFGNTSVFRLVFGIALTAFAANELFRPRLRAGLPGAYGTLAGAVGGFLSGAFTTAGPPLAMYIYSQHKDPVDLKGTLQTVFMFANLWRLANVVVVGRGFSMPVLKLTGVALPIVIVFSFLGHRLSRRVSGKTFLLIVYSFIAAAGLLNIARGLV
ncbi:MAG: sulfite exporter TauE/SafE family protein [Deltaproteobacteria bacterium]|nr:MAG: sulfite exporter TauE/SafE family protein [Deltaproteobacteria bacterium]